MTTLLLPADHDPDSLPAGVRVSTSCWTRKIIELIDPDRYHAFDAGVGQRGHDMEALVLGRVFGLSDASVGRALRGARVKRGPLAGSCPGGCVATQVRVPFAGGVSHVDWVVRGAGDWRDGAWELKSAVKLTSPTADHYEQVQLRMLLAERAGLDFGAWHIMLVDPSSYRTYGPFRVELPSMHWSAMVDRWEALERVLGRLDTTDTDDPDAFEGLECSCGACFRAEPETASSSVDALLWEYSTCQSIIDAAESGDVVCAREAQERIRGELRARVAPGASHDNAGWRVRASNPKTRTKTAWDKADRAGIIETSLGTDAYAVLRKTMRDGGYEAEATATSSLTIQVVR